MNIKRIVNYFVLICMSLIMVACIKKSSKDFIIKTACISAVEKKLTVEISIKKKIGKIHGLYIGKNGTFSDAESIDNNASITVMARMTDMQEEYVEGQHYLIQVIWYGGRLDADSIYCNGNFEIVSEHYSNRF